MQNANVSKVEINPQGLSMITRTGGATITSASYSATTLILTVNYTFAPFGGVAGAWVTVTGLSPSALNGTYLLITFTGTQATMQNYYGSATAVTVSSAFMQLLTTATQGVVFGDSTFRTTAKAPIITIITKNSAVPNTPMALLNYYTTPIGCRYLRVRMVGAGGGGTVYNNTPGANSGGYSIFGSYIAYGGACGLNVASAYWNNPVYAYMGGAFQGGLGGGTFQVISYSWSAGQGRIDIATVFGNIPPTSTYYPAVGSTITLNGMTPASWNGAFTVVSCTTTGTSVSIYFTLPSYTAVTGYGMVSWQPPDSNTITIPGGQGDGGWRYSSGSYGGCLGGCSAWGANAPGWGQTNPSGALTAQPPLPLGAFCFGGGGAGGGGVSGNTAGCGGGGGQYLETYISNPASSYVTIVGQGGQGSGGDAGARYNSAPGFNGVIVVEAHF